MSYYSTTLTINSPLEKVFDTVAHIENFSKAVPEITKVEFLSETKKGAGTRFKETRLMGKRENTVELEVTEYKANERIRIVSDTGGAIWDSVFSVSAVDDSTTELNMQMDTKAQNFAAKLMLKMVQGKVAKAITQDMQAVKFFCESEG